MPRYSSWPAQSFEVGTHCDRCIFDNVFAINFGNTFPHIFILIFRIDNIFSLHLGDIFIWSIFFDKSDLQYFNVCLWLISVEHTRHCLEENKSQVVHFHLSVRSHIFNRSSIVVGGCHLWVSFHRYLVLVLMLIYILNTFSSLAAVLYFWYSGPWVSYFSVVFKFVVI